MPQIIDIIYLSSSFYKTDAIGFKSVLADLREKVRTHLKEGWVLNGGISVSDVSSLLTIIQPMAKHEATAPTAPTAPTASEEQLQLQLRR